MFRIKIDGIKYQIPNRAKEMTLGQFSKVSDIMAKQQGFTDKIVDIISLFNKAAGNNVTIGQVKEYSRGLGLSTTRKTVVNEFNVSGRVYVYNKDPRAVSIRTIEKMILEGKDTALAMISVMYEDAQLTPNEHKDKAHIEHKMKLFADALNADDCIPALVKIGEMLFKNVNQAHDSLSMAGATAAQQ